MHTIKHRVILLLFPLLLSVLFNASALAKNNTMTITMPAEVIKRSIQDVLPMKIDEASPYVEGRLYLNSINNLTMGENSAVVEGLLIGKDLSVITRVGNQDIRIKVGSLHLPLTYDLTFRFEGRAKILYLRPSLRPPVPGQLSDMGNSVVSLLSLFDNKEYPISLTSLQSMNAKVGDQDISFNMEPVDIKVTKGQLIVRMVPKLTKTN